MKLIAPGLAGAAFALTLGIMAWRAPRSALAPPLVAAPLPQALVAPARPLTLPPPDMVAVPAAAIVEPEQQESAPDSSTESVADESDAVAAPPTLPDSGALPAYQDDQIARHADGARSARSR